MNINDEIEPELLKKCQICKGTGRDNLNFLPCEDCGGTGYKPKETDDVEQD